MAGSFNCCIGQLLHRAIVAWGMVETPRITLTPEIKSGAGSRPLASPLPLCRRSWHDNWRYWPWTFAFCGICGVPMLVVLHLSLYFQCYIRCKLHVFYCTWIRTGAATRQLCFSQGVDTRYSIFCVFVADACDISDVRCVQSVWPGMKAVYGVRLGVSLWSQCVPRHGQKSYLGRVRMGHSS